MAFDCIQTIYYEPKKTPNIKLQTIIFYNMNLLKLTVSL